MNRPLVWASQTREQRLGIFSVWFSAYKKECGIGTDVDFHSFRHTVRTKLVQQRINESIIDKLLGHAPTGSTGARTYTRRRISIRCS